MLMHYGRTHLTHAMGNVLGREVDDAMAVPVTSAGRLQDEPLICTPPTPRLQWLRRGAITAVNVGLAALLR